MLIRSKLPGNHWVKFDRNVFTMNISAGAKVLYGFLAGSQNGDAYSDKDLAKIFKISQQTLTRQKKELKDARLLLIEQIMPRVYVAYVGSTQCSAKEVKDEWNERDTLL